MSSSAGASTSSPHLAVERARSLVSQVAPRVTASAIGGAKPDNTSTTNAGPYAYTLDPAGLLTPEQRRLYDRDGYILVRGLLTEEELETWRARFVSIADGKVKGPPTMTMMRDVAIAKAKGMGEHAITKLQDWQDDPVLFEYCKHPKLRQYVQAIIGDSFKSIHTMLINKPPDVGMGSSRHPPHQDLHYFPMRPSHLIVTAWTAMQDIDHANGCLFVKPGSHKGELQVHGYPRDGVVNAAYHGIHDLTEADGEAMLHVVMAPGDTLFFHPLLVHGSGRNSSSGYRKAISTHFASTSCDYADLRGTMQDDVVKEIEAMAKHKGWNLAFNDIWRGKSRLIQGQEGTL